MCKHCIHICVDAFILGAVTCACTCWIVRSHVGDMPLKNSLTTSYIEHKNKERKYKLRFKEKKEGRQEKKNFSCNGDFRSLYCFSEPVLKVLLITCIGSFLALESFDVLGKTARKDLNAVVFYVFNPALISSNLAKSLSFKSMIMLWFMPVNIFLTFLIGTALGWLLIKLTRVSHDLHGLVLGCCAAGNMGNMLLIMIPAVCKEKSTPFGDGEVCETEGMTYASLSMAIGAIYLWSYVYNIIRVSSRKIPDVDHQHVQSDAVGTAPEDLIDPSEESIELGNGFWQTNDCAHQLVAQTTTAKVPMREKLKRQLQILAEKLSFQWHQLQWKVNLRPLFAPSTIGSIVGMIMGAVPQFHRALIGQDAPLRVIHDSVSMLGGAAIPSVTLVLGANLHKGLRGTGVRIPILVGIIVVRYIALPIIGVAIVKGAVHFGLVHASPLYQFVLLLQFALPPAVNIGTMTQMFGAGESECSVIMLATYAVASVFLTLWSTFFMWMVS